MITVAVRGGTSRLGAADAQLFGLLVARTSIWAAIRDPLHRPLMKFATLPLAITAGLAGWLLTGHLLAGILILILAVPAFLVFAAVLLLSEGALAVGADRVWVLRSGRGRACAKVKCVEAGRGWQLESVAAWPFNTGCGTDLVERICADADASGVASIRLTADTVRLTGWYARFGFVEQTRNWLGQPKMERLRPAARLGE